jgi:hypothetical protein
MVVNERLCEVSPKFIKSNVPPRSFRPNALCNHCSEKAEKAIYCNLVKDVTIYIWRAGGEKFPNS